MSSSTVGFQGRIDVIYKVLVIGDPGVGKGSLLTKFATNQFTEKYLPTVGVSILKEIIQLEENVTINLMFWDVAGQPQFYMLHRPYFNGADGIVLVFDVARSSTFSNINNWYSTVVKYGLSRIPCILVGNKVNLKDDRKITIPMAEHLSEKLKAPYFETCALTGENVKEIFYSIAKLIYRAKEGNIESEKSDLKPEKPSIPSLVFQDYCKDCDFFENNNCMFVDTPRSGFKCEFDALFDREVTQQINFNPLIKPGTVNERDILPRKKKRFKKQWIDYFGVIHKKKDQIYSNIELEYLETQDKLDTIAESFFSGVLDEKIFEIYSPYVDKYSEETLQIPKYYFYEKEDIIYLIIGVFVDSTYNLILEKMASFIESLIKAANIDMNRLTKSNKVKIQNFMMKFTKLIEDFLYFDEDVLLRNELDKFIDSFK